MARDLDLITQYTKLLMRGYYKLFTICVVLVIMSCVVAFAVKQLWASPTSSDNDMTNEVSDASEWVDDIMARTNVESKYRVHNAKLDEMVARGGMSPIVAKDAKRDSSIFDRSKDMWTDAREHERIPEGGSVPTAFNPHVTLTGV
jgi:hypothetical protein